MLSRRQFVTAVGAGVAGSSVAGVGSSRAQADTPAASPAPASTAPSTAWTRRYAESHLTRVFTVVPVGGGYVLGGVTGSHDDLRALVVRTDAVGRARWQRTYGTTKSGIAAGAPHADGGVVLGGTTNLDDSSPFTETPLSADPWVVRLDEAGDVVWTRTLQPAAAAGRIDALVRTDGGYLVAGRRRERRATSPRPWAAHLSPAGHRRWATVLDGEAGRQRTDGRGFLTAAVGGNDAWYVGGSTSPVAGDDRHEGRDETALVARLDTDGTVRWRWSPEDEQGSRIEALHADASGVVAVGNRGFSDDDDGRGWQFRLDVDADRAWETTHSRGPWNWLDGIAPVNGADGYLLVGTREHPPEGDDLNGRRGAWVLRTDAAGEVRWETTYVDGDWSHAETVHALDGGFVIAGSTRADGNQAAWLVGAGDLPTADTASGVTRRVESLTRAVPPAADEVGLGVLLGAGAVTLGRRLLRER